MKNLLKTPTEYFISYNHVERGKASDGEYQMQRIIFRHKSNHHPEAVAFDAQHVMRVYFELITNCTKCCHGNFSDSEETFKEGLIDRME